MLPDCGALRTDGDALSFEGDCAVTFVLAARTNYRLHYPDYRDTGVDPAALAHEDANRAAALPYPTLARRHAEDYRELFSRVSLELGGVSGKTPTDKLRAGYGSGNAAGGPRARAAVLQLRPLSADRVVARRLAARQPAGRVERQGHAAVERRLPRQHQPADELLAGGSSQPRRDRRAAVRFRRSPGAAGQTRRAALFRRAGWTMFLNTNAWGYVGPIDWPTAFWQPEASAWLAQHFYEHYLFSAGRDFPEEARLAGHERRGGVLAGRAGRPIRTTASWS